MKIKNKLFIGKILFVITIFSLILLGNGNIISIYGINLREMLFLANFFAFAVFALFKNRIFLNNLIKTSLVFIFLNIAIWGLLLAVAYGNSLNYAFSDFNGVLYLLYILPWSFFAFYERWHLKFVINLFLEFVFLFSLFVNLIIIFSLLGFWDLGQAGLFFRAINYSQVSAGIMADGFPRLFWPQFVFLIPAVLFLCAESFSRKKISIKHLIILISCLVALLFSYTRGLWLGLIVGFLFLFASYWNKIKIEKFAKAVMIFFAVLFLIAIFNQNYLPLLKDRILSSFSVEDVSNNVRFSQAEFLLPKWMERPIFGNGYGATVDGLVRSVQEPYSFELVPAAFLMKFGIIGIGLWAFFFIFIMCQCRIVIKNNIKLGNAGDNWIFKAIYGSVPAIIVASMTNPYLLNAVGMGITALFVLVISIAKNQYGKN